MTEKSPYIALRPMRFGSLDLNVGDPVPIETARNYQQMLRVGQIGLAPTSEPGAGPALPEGVHQVLLPPNVLVIFVDQDGVPEQGTFLGSREPDEEARITLDLEPGQQAALVQFASESEPSLVPLDSLLSGDAAQRLVLHFQTQIDEVVVGRAAAQGQLTSATSAATTAKAQVEWLTLLLKAVQAQGEPLPEDAPMLKELAASGITTREGLHLVADGESGRANLIRLDNIGAKSADKILAWFAPEPPTAEG